MEVVQVTGAVFKTEYGEYEFSRYDMTKHGWIKICDHTLVFTIPANFNPVAAEVKMWENKLDAMIEDHIEKTSIIKDKIANLLSIEYTPKDKP